MHTPELSVAKPSRARRRALRVGAILAVGSVIAIGASIVFWFRIDPVPGKPPKIVVVLNAGFSSDSTLSHPTTTRLLAGIAVARQFGARLVTTRVYDNAGQSSDAAQGRLIAAAGLADHWDILRRPVRSTHDEALALRDAIPQATPIAIVTSPLHTRRACAIFERAGFRVTCIASRQYRWWMVVHGVVYEWLATIKSWRNDWT